MYEFQICNVENSETVEEQKAYLSLPEAYHAAPPNSWRVPFLYSAPEAALLKWNVLLRNFHEKIV
jgi:hypothetical protein